MENKGLIRVFAILLSLVSIYQLSFTFVADKVESQAQTYAESKISKEEPDFIVKRNQAEKQYLDSISSQTVLNIGIAKFTYTEVKQKELNKGLDLKGGINVILQISVKDILKGLSSYSKDPLFNKALLQADKDSKDSDKDYIELFFEAYERLDPQAKLATPSVFANKTLSDEINISMTNSEVKTIIRRKVDQSVISAFEVLRKRIDKFGVTQPNIQRLGTSGRILVELPGAKDIDRVKGLLQSTAQLEFWDTYKNTEVYPYFVSANQQLKEILKSETTTEKVPQKPVTKEKEVSSELDSLLTEVSKRDSISSGSEDINEPLLGLIKSQSYGGSPVLGSFAEKDTMKVNEYLKMPAIKSLLPDNIRYTKFLWGKPEKSSVLLDLYAIKYNREGLPPLSGGVIVDAQQTYDVGNQPAVSMQMNGKGSRIWEEMTGRAFKNKSNIAIVLDDLVYSAPGVSKGAISGGRSEITGNFSLNEAIDLSNVLRAGKLPASADIIQSEVVGPSLGQEAIDNGINSFLIAILAVLIWMILYYGYVGVTADLALILNLLFLFGVLAGLGAVLTLPGIAGIILTIGMAVDANVIIFERVKEEMRKGKSRKLAISQGFSNALSSILDANITTALTAIVLLIFGTGPIKGFATTLLIGIFTSLFSAIYISRLVIDAMIKRKIELNFMTAITKNLYSKVQVKFLEMRKGAYIISLILVLVGIVSLFTNGLNQGVDFVGGRSYQVRFDNPVKASDVSAALNDVFGSAEVKTYGASNQLKITTKYKIDEDGSEVDKEIGNKLYVALKKYLPEDLSEEKFSTADSEHNIGIMSVIKVGPTIADDIKIGALWAVFGSLVAVFLYILLRFRKWQFSLGAVMAVFHDSLIVLGVFSLFYRIMPFSMEIDQAFIAAILTVIGYSLNDTVIVFDRLRENSINNFIDKPGINKSLNETLGRTLNTSLTTLAVLVAIFIFGGEVLRGFIFAIIVGIVVGTYSSLFIATPIFYDLTAKKSNKK